MKKTSRTARATLDQIRARDGARAFRAADVQAFDLAARTVQLAFSSEAEVERWYGIEILSHAPEAVVMQRLENGAALLLQHDPGKQVGVVETVSIDADRRGRAVVRFGKSARAEEIFQDIVDGIRRHVSVGYIVHDARLIEERDGEDVWEITKWEPFEISIVSVPADIGVGVGRGLSAGKNEPMLTRNAPDSQDQPSFTEKAMSDENRAPDVKDSGAKHEPARSFEAERARVRAISEIGEMYNATSLAGAAIRDGQSVADFQRALLEHLNSRNKQVPLSEQTKAADVGLTDKEVRNYSFLRVLRALVEPTNRSAQEDAAFEFEVSRAAAEKLGKTPNGVLVPSDVLRRALNTSSTGSSNGDTGGYLVANTLMSSSFIDLLRNRTTILRMASIVGGLVGTVDIPKQTGGAQGYWVGEDEDAPETHAAFGDVPLAPKTVAAFSDITRRMLKQSSLDIEALVRLDLARALALTIDKAAYYGTGSDKQPLGISRQTGVNVVEFQGEYPTYSELVHMETETALDNADVESMAYVGNARFRGRMKTTLKFEGVPGSIWETGSLVNGYRAEITNQIESGDVFMGNFADMLVGMWGGLELNADPYSNSKSGKLRIVTFQDIDFAVRRAESFCLGKKKQTS